MTMEKKAWVEPKVEAVEFQANEYVTACYTSQSVAYGQGTGFTSTSGQGMSGLAPDSSFYYYNEKNELSSISWDSIYSAMGKEDSETIFAGDTAYNDGYSTNVVYYMDDMSQKKDLSDSGLQIFISNVDPSKVYLSYQGFDIDLTNSMFS